LAQIKSVTSEALEAQIRNLLPSQNGFGEDLQASNVITPIIDLTATAEGTTTPQYMQTALAFGSQTAFNVVNTTTNLATTPGFYRVVGTFSGVSNSSVDQTYSFDMTDGFSTKIVYGGTFLAGSSIGFTSEYDLVFFLPAGITLSATSSRTTIVVKGSIRQVADVNGSLVNPSGFTPQ